MLKNKKSNIQKTSTIEKSNVDPEQKNKSNKMTNKGLDELTTKSNNASNSKKSKVTFKSGSGSDQKEKVCLFKCVFLCLLCLLLYNIINIY